MSAAGMSRIEQAETLARWAVLVPVPKGTKGPRAKGWNSDPAQWITNPSAARDYLAQNEGAGLGLLHSESQTAALDIDHEQLARQALAAVGIDLDALLSAQGPKVIGRRGVKPLYRVPDGLSLRNKVLSIPDPSGAKDEKGRPKLLTVFELRGSGQDVMPPSIHPDTGKPYGWADDLIPTALDDLLELPAPVLKLWENWAEFEKVMLS